ncbi:MAG TPA: chaperonin [Armatimonadetes bacterium]|jgi:chaperonin GroEL (HSP60 family)|nr:chaperonin [Armatimonadota bacterium]
MNTNAKQLNNTPDGEDRFSALISNSSAVRALAASVEGTLGPKGLNCMLVDRFGGVTITNDGSTILSRVEANHPAAGMLVQAAEAQDAEVGDGTTTTAVLAGALLSEGVEQIMRGVPVAKVIEGMRAGIVRALEVIDSLTKEVSGFDDPLLWQAAYISARGMKDIADLVVEAARLAGMEQLRECGWHLAEIVEAEEGAKNQVFSGLIIKKERLNRMMPRSIDNARVLVIDDSLEPEHLEDDALGTESGFSRYMAIQEEFKESVNKIVKLGIGLVVAHKSVSDAAEEILTDAGVMVIRRASSRDIIRIAEHTGAKIIKRTGLSRPPQEIQEFLGACARVYGDERLEHTRIEGGQGRPAATILVGAATREVKEERERIARDAASAVQSVLLSGVVPGGGAAEIAAAREILALRDETGGMASYGVDCVTEALRRPLSQIVTNAGFNPLEKVEDVIAAQSEKRCASLGINCDTGEVSDMYALGVVDPAKVKTAAICTAAEIAEAILRINVIIKRRDNTPIAPHADIPAGG